MAVPTAPPATPGHRPRAAPPRRHRPDRVGYAAAAWAAVYGLVALVWTLTGDGFPFGRNDPDRELSVLRDLPADLGAPLFAGVLLATAVAALAMAGPHAVRLRGPGRRLLLAAGWAVAAALLVVVPDTRLLAVAGYAPMLLLGAPFGWPPVDYAEVFTWALINQAWCVVGGFLVARTVLAWQRRSGGSCVACGRGEAGAAWATPAAAARWGRWATAVAAAIPLLYAATRLAWLVGIPLGISEAFLRELRDSGAVWAGAGLGAFAVVGAVLTLGLVQRWGEVFPRWMVGLAGRRVPVMLAVAPASVVAVMVTSASLGLLTSGRFLSLAGNGGLATAPMLLWPLWGVALGAATLAYHLRRRGRCARCGRR
jgi:hypothetical protein